MEKKEDKSGTLPNAVSNKYTVKPGCAIGAYRWNGKEFDLRTISVEEADALVKEGFDVLVQKPGTPEKK